MIRVILSGCNGRMGQVLVMRMKEHAGMEIVAGVDQALDTPNDFPVYGRFDAVGEEADLVVDFSHISLTPMLLDFCTKKRLPLLLCTTGIAGSLEELVAEAAKTIPIFKSANMSLGIGLLQSLVRQAARVLGDAYDVEIIEKHHNKKVDAPSGTAFMIAEAAASALPYTPRYSFDRSGEHKQRDPHEIGIHSIRGGTIVGEHEILFVGAHEVLTISHSAQSRELFANGAMKAVEFLRDVGRPGLYAMDDLLRSLS